MPFRSGAFRQSLSPFRTGTLAIDSLYALDTQTSGDGTPPVPQGTPPADTSPPGATPKPPVVHKVGPLPKPRAAAKPVAKPRITANAAARPKPVAKPKPKPAVIPPKKVIVDPNQDYQRLSKPEQPGRPPARTSAGGGF